MQCAACGFVDSSVTPSDAAVALRSYPRRFRSVLLVLDEDDTDLLTRPGPDGWSALDHAAHLAASLTSVAEALRLVSIEESPLVALAPERRVDGSGAGGAGGGDGVVDQVSAALEAAAVSAAEAVERIRGKDWERLGRVNDGASMTALDVARHGVHEGVHHLRAAEQAVSSGP